MVREPVPPNTGQRSVLESILATGEWKVKRPQVIATDFLSNLGITQNRRHILEQNLAYPVDRHEKIYRFRPFGPVPPLFPGQFWPNTDDFRRDQRGGVYRCPCRKGSAP